MEEKKTVAEVTQRLREIEDYNLAFRLQEEEYLSHYHRNREGRRLVGDDTKQSIVEQAKENQQRIETIRKITESDEELARRLQQQFEEEEKQRLDELARKDAELARRLANNDEQSTSALSTIPPPVHPSHANPVRPPPLIDLSDQMATSSSVLHTQPDLLQQLPTPMVTSSVEKQNVFTSPNIHQAPPVTLHPTNPFLQDLSKEQVQGSTQYYSEFGLPPPSDLALGKKR
ncbi:hypothetical protein RB195_020969 [Necator americanus]|uniref:Coiled-coil domain-containing protein n=1 Tax=Necator americanus TaxID=51031 RepID=A0ABR1CLH1_NECAM